MPLSVENQKTSSINIPQHSRYVAFNSNSDNLVSGDTNGGGDVFVKDTLTGVTSIVSTSSSGVGSSTTAGLATPKISADGRYVAFDSWSSNLVANDTNGIQDVFVKDRSTGELIRASTDSNNQQANGSSFLSYTLSADARYLAFLSLATNLTPGGASGLGDVYLKDLETGSTKMVSINSQGIAGNNSTYRPSLSTDGRYIAYTSFATNMIAGDTNGATDIFLRDLSTAGVQQMSGMVVSNQASAKVTLDLAAQYQEELNLYRAGMGASSSRIETFINTLRTSEINYASAASQILDADIAEESAKLTANQIFSSQLPPYLFRLINSQD